MLNTFSWFPSYCIVIPSKIVDVQTADLKQNCCLLTTNDLQNMVSLLKINIDCQFIAVSCTLVNGECKRTDWKHQIVHSINNPYSGRAVSDFLYKYSQRATRGPGQKLVGWDLNIRLCNWPGRYLNELAKKTDSSAGAYDEVRMNGVVQLLCKTKRTKKVHLIWPLIWWFCNLPLLLLLVFS